MERLDSTQLLDLELLDAGDDNVLDLHMLEEIFDNDLAVLGFQPQPEYAVPGAPVAQEPMQQLLQPPLYPSAAPHFGGAPLPIQPVMQYQQPSNNHGLPELGGSTSGEHSGETMSSGQDVQGAATGRGGRAHRSSAAGGSGDQTGKKKRTRNAQQMELNRIAQQKYRERKKAEHNELQSAVDQLAAQLAAFKVLEVRANQLEASNASLQSAVVQKDHAIASLQQQVESQQQALQSVRADLVQSQELVVKQQEMILDQHTKIALQNQVIESLKDQLRCKIDDAMECAEPGSVCDKLVAAVKAAIYGARNMEELQDQLDKIPPALVTEICKNIFCVIKETFPEIKARCNALAARGMCTAQCPAA